MSPEDEVRIRELEERVVELDRRTAHLIHMGPRQVDPEEQAAKINDMVDKFRLAMEGKGKSK